MTFLSMRSSIPLVAILALAVADCADKANCDDLRQSLYEQKKQWASCSVDADCIIMPGNSKDCTGVLACPFAISRGYLEPAERTTLTIGDDSVDCHLCATPNCSGGTLAVCEPVTHQCLIVAGTPDAGASGGGSGFDSGVTQTPVDTGQSDAYGRP